MNDKELKDKRHVKNPNNYKNAKLKIYAAEKSDLHEITLSYVKTLDNNGAWDFNIEHIDDENLNIVAFKYNGTITAADAISKLHFSCKYTITSEWGIKL
ncbi:MAG: hypothetical protein HDT24_03195 [Ruminococcus sp.]|nr:hypothetical protein [Ruminococcus sp.]